MYNLIKEGDLFNSFYSTYFVTASGLTSLYDGKYEDIAYVVPAGSVSSVIIEFGEYFSVKDLKIFTSTDDVSFVSSTYGLEYADDSTLSLTSSGTYFYGSINDTLGKLCVTISGTTSISVYQVYLEGNENVNIGFGTSSSGAYGSLNFGGGPIGYTSSNIREIPLYNEYPFDVDIKVAVAPTHSGSDNYVYISDERDGVFYGINEHGIKQPSFTEISDVDQTLDLDDISSLYVDWDLVLSSSTYLDNRDGYLRISADDVYIPVHRLTSDFNGYTDCMLVSKHPFTANQSFNISMDVRVIDSTLDNMLEVAGAVTPNKFMLGFTDSYPIRNHFTEDIDKDRVGSSLSAVWVGALTGLGELTDLCVGVISNDNDFSNYVGNTNFHTTRTENNSHPIVSSILMETLSEDVFKEAEYTDGSADAPWRTLRVSYDHRIRKCSYFIDDVFLGDYVYSGKAFFDKCHFFFGFNGVGKFIIDVRNFVVDKNDTFELVSFQTLATAYGSYDEDHLPVRMISGEYDTEYFTNCWLSAPYPERGDYFSVSFGREQDVGAVRVRQPSSTEQISISGTIQQPARYAINSMYLYFDTGDIRIASFSEVEPEGLGGWDVSYLTTLSGTIEPVKNTTLVSGVINTMYDRGSTKTPVLAIDKIEFYTVSGTEIQEYGNTVSGTYGWENGERVNLTHFGNSGSLGLLVNDKFDVSCSYDCSRLTRYADYDVSIPVFKDDSWSTTSYLHHYFETIFMINDRDDSISEGSVSGRTCWFWRYFDNKENIKGVFLSIISGDQTFGSAVDKFKVQYLKDGGNPNDTSDWSDIPPISVPYSETSDYKTYTEYLISNNDGEYYTDVIGSLDFSSGYITLPSSLLCQRNSYNNPDYLIRSSGRAIDIYVEFDQAYYTQGIKVLVADGYEDSLKTTPSTGYTFDFFMCFSEECSGYYISPVFDVGTKQNTERIYSDISKYDGNYKLSYRSSNISPSYKYSSSYERWESVCSPFGGIDYIVDFSPFYGGAEVVPYGDYFYFLGQNTDRMMVYNVNTCKWSWGAYYPVETTGEDIKPDLLTVNNTAIVGDTIVCACTSDGGGGTRTSGLMKYNLVDNQYDYTGWELFPYQRQAEAVISSMVSDGSNRLFFIAVDGTVSVFYVSNGLITTENRAYMPLHGYSRRSSFVPAYVDGKIYVFGGLASTPSLGPGDKLDVYDIGSDTWSSLSDAPYSVEIAQVIHYNGYLYILPISATTYGQEYAVFMKYDISNDLWKVLPSLSYNYVSHYVAAGAGFTGNVPRPQRYFIREDYIYSLDYTGSELDFRRFKVGKDIWESGYIPDVDNVSWNTSGGIDWSETTISGETMPQDRYIQYKVSLLSSGEDLEAPVINGSTIVSPLTIPNVPSSGTKSVYVKTGVSLSADYESWYIGYTKNIDNNYYSSIIYTHSDNGYEFGKSVSALYGITISGSSYIYSYYDICSIKNGNNYEMWATNALSNGDFSFTDGVIHRLSVSNGYTCSFDSVAITGGKCSPYDDWVFSPCVLKESDNYYMWYTSVDSSGVNRVLYANSTDGFVWSNQTLSLDINSGGLEDEADYSGVSNPSVLYVDGVYYVWFEGEDRYGEKRIIKASSNDGINWSNKSVVLEKEDLSDYFMRVISCKCPRVVYDVDTYRMWFVCDTNSEDFVVYCDSSNGITWGNFKVAISRKHQGEYDYSKISSVYTLITRPILSPSVHSGKIKIYND